MINSIFDLKDAEYNPRHITDSALCGLVDSISEYGDLSGIVWNKKTGNLVCGHQRKKAIIKQYGDAVRIENDPPRIVAPDGTEFSIRVVDWPQDKEVMANIAANSEDIQGKFSEPSLAAILQDLDNRKADIYKTGLDKSRIKKILKNGPLGESQSKSEVKTPRIVLSILPKQWLLMGDSIKNDLSELCEKYGIIAQWPD